MSQHEYYIRQPSDTDARGPFTFEQLSTLARTNGLSAATLYFDADSDQWKPLADVPELAALLPKTNAPATSSLAVKLTIALLLVSAFTLAFPALRVFREVGGDTILRHPLIWLAALDVIMAACCALFGARFFRFIRIRAALGASFLCTIFWLQSSIDMLAAALVASLCLWLLTTFANTRALLATVIAGLAALGMLAYCLLS